MAEVPYFIPNLSFNSWVWYSKFLIDEEVLFFSRNDQGDLRKIRNIWEDVHKSKINCFAGIWIPDTSINSFVHLLVFKENNFLPSHSHVWQRTEIFPFPWEKLFLKVPMYSSKRLAKYQNLTKAKKREYLSFPGNKSKPPTQKEPLPNYSTKWSHGENLQKQKWSFSLHREKKGVRENFHMIIWKKK